MTPPDSKCPKDSTRRWMPPAHPARRSEAPRGRAGALPSGRLRVARVLGVGLLQLLVRLDVDLHAAVLGPALVGGVARSRVRVAETLRDQPRALHAGRDQVARDRLGARLRQLAVGGRAGGVAGVRLGEAVGV